MHDDLLRLPPQAVEAEQSILGALMLDNSVINQAVDLHHDFYQRGHQVIYDAIVNLDAKNIEIDVITVSEYLSEYETLDSVGGLSYLGILAKNTPNIKNVKAYVKIIKEKSILRKLIEASAEIIATSYQPEGKKPDEILDYADSLIGKILHNSTSLDSKHIKEFLPSAIDDLEARWKSGGEIVGIPTGFELLDKAMLGLEGGETYIIAGRPAMGKTAFALNIAQHIGLNGGKSLFISMEMPINQLINRMLSSYSVDHGKIRSGKVDNDDWTRITKAVGDFNESGIYVDESPSLSVSKISAIVKKRIKKSGKMPVFIDYLQIMGADTNRGRFEDVTAFSMGLKALAKTMNIPIVILSQLSRSVEQRQNKRPLLSDLRESGAIEQDATGVIFLYRDEVYNKDSEYKGFAEADLAKIRNGVCGTIPLGWQGEFQRFNNLDMSSLNKFNNIKQDSKTFNKRGLA